MAGITEALSTLGLLGFALWQMSFVRRSTAAAETAATQAKEAAQASRASVTLERPWVVTTGIVAPTIRVIAADNLLSAGVTFKNIGKGPAWLKRLALRFRFLVPPLSLLEGEPVYDSDQIINSWQPVERIVVAGGEDFTRIAILEGVVLTADQVAALNRGEALLAVYGVIEYEGHLGEPHLEKPYTTGFGWTYRVPLIGDMPTTQLAQWVDAPLLYRFFR